MCIGRGWRTNVHPADCANGGQMGTESGGLMLRCLLFSTHSGTYGDDDCFVCLARRDAMMETPVGFKTDVMLDIFEVI